LTQGPLTLVAVFGGDSVAELGRKHRGCACGSAARRRTSGGLIRTGLIWNQHSHRNRGAGRSPLPDGVLDVVPEDESQLFAELRHFAAAGVELVAVDGGDGTIREVLTRLPEAWGGRPPPPIALRPSGKTNALALDIGVPLGTTLEQLMAAAEAGRSKRRRCLEILRPGQVLPERRGFLFGAGAFVRATELAQRNHGLGLFDNAAIAVTLAGATVRTLLGGPNDPWRRGETARLAAGEVSDGPWFVIMASTLKRLPMGLRPFGLPREGLKLLSAAAPPKRLLSALSVILPGRDAPWLAAQGYRREDLAMFALDLPGAFVLDGEIFEGGELSVREGPELEFVVP
jgi:hypothetical protein